MYNAILAARLEICTNTFNLVNGHVAYPCKWGSHINSIVRTNKTCFIACQGKQRLFHHLSGERQLASSIRSEGICFIHQSPGKSSLSRQQGTVVCQAKSEQQFVKAKENSSLSKQNGTVVCQGKMKQRLVQAKGKSSLSKQQDRKQKFVKTKRNSSLSRQNRKAFCQSKRKGTAVCQGKSNLARQKEKQSVNAKGNSSLSWQKGTVIVRAK